MNLDLVNLLLICVVELSIPMAYVEGSIFNLGDNLTDVTRETSVPGYNAFNSLDMGLEYPSGFL